MVGKRVIVVVLGLGMMLLGIVGCYFSAAKQAVYTVSGPDGEYVVIRQPADRAEFLKYRAAEVVPFENEMPGVISQAVVDAVPSKMSDELKELKYLNSVKTTPVYKKEVVLVPTAVITGRLIDVTEDRYPGQKLIEGGNYLIARVRIIDKSTGKLLLEANVRGVVKSAIDLNEVSAAKGLARGAKKMLGNVAGWKN